MHDKLKGYDWKSSQLERENILKDLLFNRYNGFWWKRSIVIN